ncbi:MAG: GspE/PulE family protein [Desulfobacterales bacterium]|nr:GspE/PulE family protein [Desulfobacterales bacterium]
MRTDIESRINEAEVCRSMGLFSESLAIYEKILPSVPSQSEDVMETIRGRIGLLRQEIAKEDATSVPGVSAKEISWIREAISSSGDLSAILDSASAFQEMGLHEEAVNEYAKLLGENFPLEKIVPALSESLLKVHSPAHVAAGLNALLESAPLDSGKASRVKHLVGVELEKRDQRDAAHDLYKAAAELNPSDAEIAKSLASVVAAFASGSKYDYLLRERMVTTDQLQKAFGLAKKSNRSVEHVLIETFKIKKEAIGKSFSLFYGCKFRAFDPTVPAPFELLANLKKAFLLNELWIPMSWSKEGIEVLVDDPRNLNKTDNIKALLKTAKISVSVAIREDIQAFIGHFFDKDRGADAAPPPEEVTDDVDIPDITFEEEKEETTVEEADESSSQVVKLVDQVIIAAYRKNASDIHIEPSVVTKATSIRFRLDGVCQEYMKIPNAMVRGVVSRIKIMSNLDIAERRLPQDGKIKFRRKGVPPFEMRVATLPTAGGFEDVVLRILASSGALGKTTTLHGLLGHINKPGVKIWTAEDPIEITQQGLRQVEVKPKIGLDFARVMRAFLRADPDVIMIGEMRDEETASIGIEASLTGHLVFSTLHTNSAPETITRLLDMGLNALNFSDAFLGVLAQRLTRRLCANCRKEHLLTREEFDGVVQNYGSEWFGRTAIEYAEGIKIYKPAGCENCSNTGYRGRMGIHELMEGTPEVKLLIKKQANTEEIQRIALEQGMATLKQDGIGKVFKGLTDMSEVRRVCIQ